MLAVIGDPIVQKKALDAFHPLGKNGRVRPWETPGHLDGWGIVAYGPNGPVRIAHSPGDVDGEAEAYAAASARAVEHHPKLTMAHFRKATRGKVCAENTQPFTEGRWIFCHNGTVTELEKLGPRPAMTGSTDSEEFFLRWCAQGKDITRYRSWVDLVAATCAHTSLTSLITDGEHLLACRRASGVLLDPLPAGVEMGCVPCSYTVHHWTNGAAHVLCSEVLAGFAGPWQDMANGDVLSLTI